MKNKNYFKRIQAVFDKKEVYPVPKGELWLGTQLLKASGFSDTIESHIKMVEKLGHDMISIPVTDDTWSKPDLGYRYFNIKDLKLPITKSDRFVAAVVDGPFQELVNKMGLMAAMTEWVKDRSNMMSNYNKEEKICLDLIDRSLAIGVHAIVIADDFASEQGPLISPADIQTMCSNFYSQAVDRVHKAKRKVLVHSCGKITQLAHLFDQWGVDGLAAIQMDINPFEKLKSFFKSHIVVMGGIDSQLLNQGELTPEQLLEFKKTIEIPVSMSNLILSSSCGLYSADFSGVIKELYTVSDALAD